MNTQLLRLVQAAATKEGVDMADVESLGGVYDSRSFLIGDRVYNYRLMHTKHNGGVWGISSVGWWKHEVKKGCEWITCRECGVFDEAAYDIGTAKQMSNQRLCFSCNLWTNRVEQIKKAGYGSAIIDGHLYSFGSQTKPGNSNGFGGAWFYVEFFDGHKVKSCDVRHGGDIPTNFLIRLPDNARFLNESSWSVNEAGEEYSCLLQSRKPCFHE